MTHWGHSWSVLLAKCYCGDHIKKNRCVGLWRGWGRGILLLVVGGTGGNEVLGKNNIDGRIILSGSARNGLEFELGWSFFGRRLVSGCCENHSESLGCMNCVELLDWLRYCSFVRRIVLRAVRDYFVSAHRWFYVFNMHRR